MATPTFDYSVLQQGQPTGFAGLLSSPIAQGLLSAGLGALASRGTTSQAIGRGGLLGLSAFGQAAGENQNRLMQMAQAKMRQDALNGLTPDASGNVSATPTQLVTAGFTDPSKWSGVLNVGEPDKKLQQSVFNQLMTGGTMGSVPGGGQGGQPGGMVPSAARLPVAMDMVFNGGKGIAALLKPNLVNMAPGSTAYDPMTNSVRFVAPSTEGTQIQYDANGAPHVVVLPGALNATAATAAAQQGGKGSVTPFTSGVDAQGNPLPITNQTQAATGVMPAPMRNNNPGALMPGGKLAQFPDIASGMAALDQNLQRYGQGGVNTVAGVIGKWAPPNENDTGAYIADVSKRLGISPNQQIDLSNPMVRQALGTAIAIHENGSQGVFGTSAQPIYGAAPPGAVERANATGQVVGKDTGETLTGQKLRTAITDAASLDASFQQLGKLRDTTDLILKSPGFSAVTGANLGFNRLGAFVPGTDAANASAQLDTLKSQIAQNVLQTYRDMSKTGGAVGQVSEVEQKMFMNNLAALSQNQSPEAMRKSLQRINSFVDGSMQRLERAYDAQYGAGTFKRYQSGDLTMSGQPLTPNTPQQSARTVVRTGQINGRKVIQFSDGSVSYAD